MKRNMVAWTTLPPALVEGLGKLADSRGLDLNDRGVMAGLIREGVALLVRGAALPPVAPAPASAAPPAADDEFGFVEE